VRRGWLAVPDSIVIAPFDPKWASLYESAVREVRAILSARLLGVEHIGSTAVVGLAAKPIIDVLVGVASLKEVDGARADFERHGWEFPADVNAALVERRFGKKTPRTHHVHIVVFVGEEWRRLVAFRDALRNDASLAREYEQLKRELARKYRDSREKYTAAKTAFVERVFKGNSLSIYVS